MKRTQREAQKRKLRTYRKPKPWKTRTPTQGMVSILDALFSMNFPGGVIIVDSFPAGFTPRNEPYIDTHTLPELTIEAPKEPTE